MIRFDLYTSVISVRKDLHSVGQLWKVSDVHVEQDRAQNRTLGNTCQGSSSHRYHSIMSDIKLLVRQVAVYDNAGEFTLSIFSVHKFVLAAIVPDLRSRCSNR